LTVFEGNASVVRGAIRKDLRVARLLLQPCDDVIEDDDEDEDDRSSADRGGTKKGASRRAAPF
jgi:hypothetical protein